MTTEATNPPQTPPKPSPAPPSETKSSPPLRLNPRQIKFCQLIAAGASHSTAYRSAYKKPRIKARAAADSAKEVLIGRGVREYIDALRAKAEGKTILSLNDRLALLAKSAQRPVKSAADVNAQARVIEVYSRISGDQAPERQDITVKGDATAPLQMVSRPATKAEKVAALIAAGRARKAAATAALTPAPEPVVAQPA